MRVVFVDSLHTYAFWHDTHYILYVEPISDIETLVKRIRELVSGCDDVKYVHFIRDIYVIDMLRRYFKDLHPDLTRAQYRYRVGDVIVVVTPQAAIDTYTYHIITAMPVPHNP